MEIKVTEIDDDLAKLLRAGGVSAISLEAEPPRHEAAGTPFNKLRSGAARASQHVFLLEWEGKQMPVGAVVANHKIGWTQHGTVQDDAGRIIGVYEQIVDSHKKKMLVFVF